MLADVPRILSERVDGEALEREIGRLNAHTHFEDALKFSRKDGGGAVVVFLEDGLPPSEPVQLDRITAVRGFKAFSRWEVIPVRWDSSTGPSWYGERFGQPSHYVIAPSSGGLNHAAGTWHRSRVIPFPHLRLERRLTNQYGGWGPGVIEGIFVEYVTRASGILRTGDILRGFGYDHLEWEGLQDALAREGGPADVKMYLENLKACRDFTGGGVAVVATDKNQAIKPLDRRVTGVDKLIEAQRQYFLDVIEYPEVVIFTSTRSGLGSDEAAGEWKQYEGVVYKGRARTLWPGYRQALILMMAAALGPTDGVVDFDVRADWPSVVEDDAKGTAEARWRNAEARRIDVETGVVTPQEVRSTDRTLRDAYPEADLDEKVAAPAGAGPTEPAENEEQQDAAGVAAPQAAPPPVPEDLITEAKARKRFAAGRVAFRRAVEPLVTQGRVWTFGGQRRFSLTDIDAAIRGQETT